ncbi:hypothetical protein [Amycolatopsis jiangsuensis]|uniref:Uncharacterized protein n=1 Tax=Amycolatopsis jiangsuensis TaxID=1181879 RepID=A0A840J5Z9_9PSEU|nr:hypothetical protein [Amycolatopsis jiangsuensis]MBB4689213.1 hypothetical protein [Amycolatopsis jiangsuensis]
MTVLAGRYRNLLRVLPAHYRDRWEDDMVATFLETVDRTGEDPDFEDDCGRPDFRETASVLALAVRLRIGEGGESAGGRPRRYVVAADAVRRFALLSTMFHAALAVVMGILRLTWPTDIVRTTPTPALLAGLLWLPAFLALLAGKRTWAVALPALATGVTVARLVEFPTLTTVAPSCSRPRPSPSWHCPPGARASTSDSGSAHWPRPRSSRS